jgi:hypothetical protein
MRVSCSATCRVAISSSVSTAVMAYLCDDRRAALSPGEEAPAASIYSALAHPLAGKPSAPTQCKGGSLISIISMGHLGSERPNSRAQSGMLRPAPTFRQVQRKSSDRENFPVDRSAVSVDRSAASIALNKSAAMFLRVHQGRRTFHHASKKRGRGTVDAKARYAQAERYHRLDTRAVVAELETHARQLEE